MKKLLIATIITLATAVAVPSFAMFTPDWERPLHKSEMDVVSANGVFETAFNATLVLNKRDNSKDAATSFTLEFFSENEDGVVEEYLYEIAVKNIRYTRCGSTFFTANIKLYDPELATGYFPEMTVTLERKSPIALSRCGGMSVPPGGSRLVGRVFDRELASEEVDAPSNVWNATVEFKESGSVQSLSTMKLVGTPDKVYTIQGPSDI